MERAVFLDRDGVLIKDVNLLTRFDDIHILESVPAALWKLKAVGFKLIVISNQSVVARGLLSEQDVCMLQTEIERLLRKAGSPDLDGFYFCPHHPNATLKSYRVVCECRKPRSGLLLQAAKEHDLILSTSIVIGDRITDIIAGKGVVCRTVLVQTGKHLSAPIETVEPIDESVIADYVCKDLMEAVEWILKRFVM